MDLRQVSDAADFSRFFFNSVIISAVTVSGLLATSDPAALVGLLRVPDAPVLLEFRDGRLRR